MSSISKQRISLSTEITMSQHQQEQNYTHKMDLRFKSSSYLSSEMSQNATFEAEDDEIEKESNYDVRKVITLTINTKNVNEYCKRLMSNDRNGQAIEFDVNQHSLNEVHQDLLSRVADACLTHSSNGLAPFLPMQLHDNPCNASTKR